MKIAILTQFYAPEPAFKMPDLASKLVARGHDVQVLTGYPCYPSGVTYRGYRQWLPSVEVIDGVTVRRVPQFPDHSRSAVRRALYYLTFALSAAVFGAFLLRRSDVLLAYQSAMPTGLAARWLAFCRRMPLVLDVVDLWPESVTASGMLRDRRAVWIIERAIRFVYRGARRINVITQGYWDNLLAKGVRPDRLSLIHCWPASGRFDPVAPDEVMRDRLGLRGKFVVTYAGAMGPVQNLATVLEAASLLRDDPEIRFCLAGDGVQADSLREEAARRNLENVQFLGRCDPAVVQQLYALSDTLLVHLKSDPVSDVSIPSKTFAYLAAGRPVVMAVAGVAADLIEKERCGVAAAPDDPSALAKAVRSLRDAPAARLERLAVASRQAYRERYCSEVQVEKFERLLLGATGHAAEQGPMRRRAA